MTKLFKQGLALSFAIIFIIALFPLATNAESQMEMNDNAAMEAKKDDQKLNAIYSAVIKKYGDNTTFISKLRTSERAWIQFRDAHVKSVYPAKHPDIEYGQLYSVCYPSELSVLTQKRTTQLSKLLTDEIKPLPNARDDFASAEKTLNITYQKALAKYSEPENLKFFKRAQVKWLAYREAESIAVSALARPEDIELVKTSIQINLDQERTKELAEWANGLEKEDACVGSHPIHF